jgi:hypothetical protein
MTMTLQPKPATPPAPAVVDKKAAEAFVDALIGWETLGVAGDEEITRPKAPEARAHLSAVLGEHMPVYANHARPGSLKAALLGAYLRSVADVLDPPKVGATVGGASA